MLLERWPPGASFVTGARSYPTEVSTMSCPASDSVSLPWVDEFFTARRRPDGMEPMIEALNGFASTG